MREVGFEFDVSMLARLRGAWANIGWSVGRPFVVGPLLLCCWLSASAGPAAGIAITIFVYLALAMLFVALVVLAALRRTIQLRRYTTHARLHVRFRSDQVVVQAGDHVEQLPWSAFSAVERRPGLVRFELRKDVFGQGGFEIERDEVQAASFDELDQLLRHREAGTPGSEPAPEGVLALSVGSSADYEVDFRAGSDTIQVYFHPLEISLRRGEQRESKPWSWIENLQAEEGRVLIHARESALGASGLMIDRGTLPDAVFVSVRRQIFEQWIKSPNERFAWIVSSAEMRMSHWVHSGALWALLRKATRPSFEVPWNWDFCIEWEGELLILRGRKYPGATPFVRLIVDPVGETCEIAQESWERRGSYAWIGEGDLPALPEGPQSFPDVVAWLEAYPSDRP